MVIEKLALSPEIEKAAHPALHDVAQRSTDFGFILIPRRLRHNPNKEFELGVCLNVAFALGSTFTVANLYYCQPLLITLSKAFQIPYDEISRIPTLLYAGYAFGLVFVSPLGDLIRRRQLLLLLVATSTLLTIGFAFARSLMVLRIFAFLIGIVSTTPQIFIPLAADLATPDRRGTAVSIVTSGLFFGIMFGRVMGGVIANFTDWRVVYYTAIGLQGVVVIGCYLLIPDCEAKNHHLSYFEILYSMAKYSFTEPAVVQASLISTLSSACFINFWVTLTFLLGGAPYNYSSLIIGLFALIGMAGIALGPFAGRAMDNIVPWYGVALSGFAQIIAQAVQIGAGGVHIGAVAAACLLLDVFRQTQQVSLTLIAFSVDPDARARLNSVIVLSIFIGQVAGTAIGTTVFLRCGWRLDAVYAMGLVVLELFLLLLRGPHCKRHTWFGFEGGFSWRTAAAVEKEELNITAHQSFLSVVPSSVSHS